MRSIYLCGLLCYSVLGDFMTQQFGIGYGNIQYPILDAPVKSCNEPSYKHVLEKLPGSFAILRFEDFKLPEKDFLIIRPQDTNNTAKAIKLSGGRWYGNFDAPPIAAHNITIELFTRTYPTNMTINYGFRVVGYTWHINQQANQTESICGIDRTMEAACYKFSTLMFTRSNAVARILINKNGVYSACTGWLIGSEGHFITNSQCISTPYHASRTRIEFMAQAPECPTKNGDIICNRQLACPGEVWYGIPKFITTNEELDYTILLLDKSVVAKYSFLKLRSIGPVAGEPIYIVQHPRAWGKRISDKTASGRAMVEYTGNRDISYRLDTQPMSSGSPILGSTDHAVIALHYGGLASCPNFGIRGDLIVSDLIDRDVDIPNGWI